MAVGYADGSIRLFNLDTCQSDVTFQGHKSAVTCLAYDASGLRLVSGSKVSVLEEVGVVNLTNHEWSIVA